MAGKKLGLLGLEKSSEVRVFWELVSLEDGSFRVKTQIPKKGGCSARINF